MGNSLYLFFAAVIVAMLTLQPARAMLSDGFVQVKGDQFVLSTDPDRTFKVKGFNYYPQQHPWAIFSEWDPQAINTELGIARDLNSNVVRTFVGGGQNPGQTVVNRIVEFVQITKAKNQKAMIALFDGYGLYPAAGTAEEARNFEKIEAIVGALKDDPGIFCWDIKNEPDWVNPTYWSWSLPGAQVEAERRIDWLYRMRNKIKEIAPNHLVTVGLIFNNNNYEPAGMRTVESFVDFVCYHYYPRNYPAQTFRQSITSLKAHTSKPINVQEIGHNAYGGPGATDQDQADLFRDWLEVIEDEDITGIVQWTLCDWWDGWPGPIDEKYYGFLRADGNYTWKPAAFVYRDNFVVEQFGSESIYGQLSGQVKDTDGQPIQGATITANPGSYSAQSGVNGNYSFLSLPIGYYTVTATSLGYEPVVVENVQIEAGEVTELNFVLSPALPDSLTIINPGFETGDLSGWTLWGQVDGVQSGPWYANITPRTGTYFLGTAAHWGLKNGGVYQRIAVRPNKTYTAEVWSRTYREGGAAGAVASRIGIDPQGGTNAASGSIVWGPFTESQNQWSKLSVTALVPGAQATIFLEHRQLGGTVWNINCFDDVAIYQSASSPGSVLSMPNGWQVMLTDTIVTANFGSSFYVSAQDRSSGIRVNQTSAVAEGHKVTVYGQLGNSGGERFLSQPTVQVQSSGNQVPDPLHMKASAIGGKSPLNGEGIKGASGLYNSGLLVKATGKVVNRTATYIYLDDGSGVQDGSGQMGIRVIGADAWLPQVGETVTVNGISTRISVNGEPARAIRARRAADITIH